MADIVQDHSSGLHHKFAIFLAGAFGGIAPTALRLAIDLVQERRTISELSASILVGVGLFALLGAGVAVVWKEEDIRKAFVLGVSLPSLITIITSTATAPRAGLAAISSNYSTSEAGTAGHFSFAYSPSNARILRIILPSEIGYEGAQAIFGCGLALVARNIEPQADIDVPGCADSVVIVTPDAQSSKIPIESWDNLRSVITLSAKKNPWFGLAYAVGVRGKPFDLIVSSVDTTTEQPPANPRPT